MDINIGVAGAFMVEKAKAMPNDPLTPAGPMELAAPWTDNVITDVGLNNMGTSLSNNIMRGCQIGSSNATPTTGDTALGSRLASSVTRISRSISRQLTVAPYYLDVFTVYRFAAGVGTGDIKELAIVSAANDTAGSGAMSPTAPLFSRTLPVDGSGNPTTVTKLGDEIVDVTYRLRYYLDTSDVVEVRNIGGTDYTLTLRPVRIDLLPDINGFGFGYYNFGNNTGGGNADFTARGSSGYGENALYVGAAADIAPISGGNPTGTKNTNQSGGPNSIVNSNPAYVTNSYELEQLMSVGLGTANTGYNAAGGIGCIVFSNNICSWQIGVEPHLPKTSDELCEFSVFTKWSRA